MGLKGLVSRLKRRTPEDPISHSGPKSGSNGKATFSPPPKDTEIRPIAQNYQLMKVTYGFKPL